MADLELRVTGRSTAEDGGASGVGVVARVRRLQGGSEKSVAVKVGGRATTLPGLEDGDYEVRVLMPAGGVLIKRVRLGGQGDEVVLDAGSSSTYGRSTARATQDAALAGGSNRRPKGSPASGPRSSRGYPSDDQEEAFFALAKPAPAATSAPRLLLVDAPSTLDRIGEVTLRIVDAWAALARGVRGEIGPVPMVGGAHPRTKKAGAVSPGRERWRVGFATAADTGRGPRRQYALVRDGRAGEFISLPLPWRWSVADGRWDSSECVELIAAKSASRPATSKVAVQDADYGGLLAYMNSGTLALAGELARASLAEGERTRALFEEATSPLGACAAAYVLLSTSALEDEGEVDEWRRTIEVLASSRFSWIPDASILCARLVLLTSDTAEEAAAALPHLQRALRGGLPFYSLGLSWLLEAMTMFRNDALIGAVFNYVDQVARRLDPSQAFLVLRLDEMRW